MFSRTNDGHSPSRCRVSARDYAVRSTGHSPTKHRVTHVGSCVQTPNDARPCPRPRQRPSPGAGQRAAAHTGICRSQREHTRTVNLLTTRPVTTATAGPLSRMNPRPRHRTPTQPTSEMCNGSDTHPCAATRKRAAAHTGICRSQREHTRTVNLLTTRPVTTATAGPLSRMNPRPRHRTPTQPTSEMCNGSDTHPCAATRKRAAAHTGICRSQREHTRTVNLLTTRPVTTATAGPLSRMNPRPRHRTPTQPTSEMCNGSDTHPCAATRKRAAAHTGICRSQREHTRTVNLLTTRPVTTATAGPLSRMNPRPRHRTPTQPTSEMCNGSDTHPCAATRKRAAAHTGICRSQREHTRTVNLLTTRPVTTATAGPLSRMNPRPRHRTPTQPTSEMCNGSDTHPCAATRKRAAAHTGICRSQREHTRTVNLLTTRPVTTATA